jgi:outer membrane protein assembly factor BamB
MNFGSDTDITHTLFRSPIVLILAAVLTATGLLASPAVASDWLDWRGPSQTGESPERDLISSWSRESGENLIWRQDFIGRSSAAVHDGRVFVTGRGGEDRIQHEKLAAYDAETGDLLWEHRLKVQLTTVPFQRAGWAAPVVDRETGYVYAQGIAGPLVAYDRDGNLVWERLLSEEVGRYSGYGGRTHTPLIDEDQLIVSVVNTGWGEFGAPRHRYWSFDKRTGEVIWISTPGGQPYDLNTTANGVVAVIEGRRLYINGNADGHIYALEARTGEKVWEFELSKRGINSSPIVVGNTVYAGHSEENIDEAVLGRVVAIDATGTGDVTATHEKWRREIAMGFPSPMYHDGRVYVTDNAANLFALDAETGETIWEHSLGTVGKAMPVWADGKIYATEVNGNFHILRDAGAEVEVLDTEYLTVPSGRYAEIYGSPAIAYNRIYFTTEEGIYCLGDPERPFEVSESAGRALPAEAQGTDEPATLLLVPGDVTVGLGDTVDFQVRLFNELGRELGRTDDATWSTEGLRGVISPAGELAVVNEGDPMAGHVRARIGDLEGRARVRAFGELPYREDFESVEGKGRPWWLGAGRYQVIERDGGKLLEKPVAARGLLRSILFIGPDTLHDYTVQAEVMGGQEGRRRTDVGLVNQGYILDLLGNGQDLQIRTWPAEMRMAETIEFPWEMDTWYVMKMRVDGQGGDVVVRGKVWKKGEPEPEDWTITAEDPIGTERGAPGLIGYSPAPVYWDNVVVTKN